MPEGNNLEDGLNGPAWEPNNTDARGLRAMAKELRRAAAQTRTEGNGAPLVSTAVNENVNVGLPSQQLPVRQNEASQATATAIETPPPSRPLQQPTAVVSQAVDAVPAEQPQNFTAPAIGEVPDRDQPSMPTTDTMMANSPFVEEASAAMLPDHLGREEPTSQTTINPAFSQQFYETMNSLQFQESLEKFILFTASKEEQRRANAITEEQRNYIVQRNIAENVENWRISVDAPSTQQAFSSQLQNEDITMPQHEQSPGVVGASQQAAMPPSLDQIMAQLQALTLELGQQREVITTINRENNALRAELGNRATANERPPTDARFGANPADHFPLAPEGPAMPFRPALSEMRGSQAFETAAFAAPSFYHQSQETAAPFQQTFSPGRSRGQQGELVDLSRATRPNQRIIAKYYVELTTQSKSAERDAVTRIPGAITDQAGFIPRGKDRPVGTNKYLLSPETDLGQAWNYLADGHKCDAIRAAENQTGTQEITLANHGWTQGKNASGDIFTYKSEAGPALNLNSKLYGALSPDIRDQIVMGSAGYDRNGNYRCGTYHAKAGQAIEPLAHLLSRDEQVQLEEAGFGYVHRQASALAATQQRSIPARVQNNPQLANYGMNSIAPNYAPYGYGPSYSFQATGSGYQAPRMSSQFSMPLSGSAIDQGQPFYPVTPQRSMPQWQPYGSPDGRTLMAQNTPYGNMPASSYGQQTPIPFRHAPQHTQPPIQDPRGRTAPSYGRG
jgi:hypothetical protein